MPTRKCRVPGCRLDANTGARGRCARHRQTTAERGYDRLHRAARAALQRTLPAPCAYGCGKVLVVGGAFVAAHVVDGDPASGWVASCLSCNQAARIDKRRPMPSAIIATVGVSPLRVLR